MSIPAQLCTYLYCHSCNKPDDGRVWFKHVAGMMNWIYCVLTGFILHLCNCWLTTTLYVLYTRTFLIYKGTKLRKKKKAKLKKMFASPQYYFQVLWRKYLSKSAYFWTFITMHHFTTLDKVSLVLLPLQMFIIIIITIIKKIFRFCQMLKLRHTDTHTHSSWQISDTYFLPPRKGNSVKRGVCFLR